MAKLQDTENILYVIHIIYIISKDTFLQKSTKYIIQYQGNKIYFSTCRENTNYSRFRRKDFFHILTNSIPAVMKSIIPDFFSLISSPSVFKMLKNTERTSLSCTSICLSARVLSTISDMVLWKNVK